MNTEELGKYAGRAAAVLMLAASGLASAGTQVAAASKTSEPVSVLTQALNEIRAEQRRAVQQAALKALAGLRSETLAALSKGGAVSASTSVQAQP